MFNLPDLPYLYNELEPFIDEQTLHLHHDKHHAAYTQKLNDALADTSDLAKNTIEELLSNLDQIPQEIRTKVKNNGGGYYNHSLYWKTMKPQGGGKPTGKLAQIIDQTFGDFDKFKEQFTKSAQDLFGSGWSWLVIQEDKLEIVNTPNQDCPLSLGKKPILVIDLWEHAYYLKYQNRRAEYIEAWWNLVNWEEVARLSNLTTSS